MSDQYPSKQPHGETSLSKEAKPNEEVVDQAISDALDGYAADSEIWVAAREAFYARLEKKGRNAVPFALRDALRVAADGAESTEAEAQKRFWDVYDGEGEILHTGIEAQDFEAGMGLMSGRIDDFLSSCPEKNHIVYSLDNQTRSESRSLSSAFGLDAKRIDSSGGVSRYEIFDTRHVLGDQQTDTYSWEEGGSEVIFRTVGPKLHERALNASEAVDWFDNWREQIDAVIVADEHAKERANPRIKKALKGIGRRAIRIDYDDGNEETGVDALRSIVSALRGDTAHMGHKRRKH